MSPTPSCPECGAPLAADAPLSVCPRCILGLGLGPAPTGEHVRPGAPDPAAVPADLARLFPQLEILDEVGRGGMGIVYRARQVKLDRLVALKLVRPESARDPGFAARFAREAKAMARLGHPHVVMVHDFGEAGDLCYLVMELVEGHDLRAELAHGALVPGRALAIAIQICDALEYAHAQGVIHRDIKPENVLIDPRLGIKLADFGLAKLLVPDDPDNLTFTRHLLGTPRYMAPEQLERPREVDHRADVYAVGLLLYEMLTGEVPFGRYEPASDRADVDDDLDAIIDRALARDAAQRYQSAAELRADLAAYAEESCEPDELRATGLAQPVAVPAGSDEVRDLWAPLLALAAFGLAWIGGEILYENLPTGPARNLIFAAGLFLLVNAAGVWLSWFGGAPGWLLVVGLVVGLPRLRGVIEAEIPPGWGRLLAYAGAGLLALNALAWWRGWRSCDGEAAAPPGPRAPSSDPGRSPLVEESPAMAARRAVRWPAIGVTATGVLNILLAVAMIFLTSAETNGTGEPFKYLPILALWVLVLLVLGAVAILGGLMMLELRSRTWGLIGAAAAGLGLSLFMIFGIPFGLWAALVLTRPEVRRGFAAARAGEPPGKPTRAAPPGPSAIAGDSRRG